MSPAVRLLRNHIVCIQQDSGQRLLELCKALVLSIQHHLEMSELTRDLGGVSGFGGVNHSATEFPAAGGGGRRAFRNLLHH